MVLCNMSVEMGAKTSYIQPDEITLNYLKSRGRHREIGSSETDPDYEYSEIYNFDVS